MRFYAILEFFKQFTRFSFSFSLLLHFFALTFFPNSPSPPPNDHRIYYFAKYIGTPGYKCKKLVFQSKLVLIIIFGTWGELK